MKQAFVDTLEVWGGSRSANYSKKCRLYSYPFPRPEPQKNWRPLSLVQVRKTKTLSSTWNGWRMDKLTDPVSLSHSKLTTKLMYVQFLTFDAPRLKASHWGQREPVEALFRSVFLVLMDNATAEYSFVTSFFSPEAPAPPSSKENDNSTLSPTATIKGGFDERRSAIGHEIGGHKPRGRADSTANSVYATPKQSTIVKTERAPLDTIWKQIMDPTLEYCQVCSVTRPLGVIYAGLPTHT
jgi:hypothetical protein